MNKVNQRNEISSIGANETGMTNQAEGEVVGYYLAYPGILPSNLLYPVKMARDRVNVMLTYGQKAKAEKMLLFADKRIATASILFFENKSEMAIGIAFKAEEYSFRAAKSIVYLTEDISQLKQQMVQSNLKHAEILREIESKLSAQIPDNFRAALDYNTRTRELLQEN